MNNEKSHIGETHGIYTIVEIMDYKTKDGHNLYRGICNTCGYERVAKYSDFTKLTNSCTHLNIFGKIKEDFNFRNHRLAKIYYDMIRRCYNSNDKSYRWYGEKGIKICDEWIKTPSTFEEWALSNGYKDDLTIDRIDPTKNYYPENCRWITLEQNSKYKSTTTLIQVDNEIHTGREWSKILNLGENTINTMLRKFSEFDVKEFIRKRKQDKTRNRVKNQSWMQTYGII